MPHWREECTGSPYGNGHKEGIGAEIKTGGDIVGNRRHQNCRGCIIQYIGYCHGENKNRSQNQYRRQLTGQDQQAGDQHLGRAGRFQRPAKWNHCTKKDDHRPIHSFIEFSQRDDVGHRHDDRCQPQCELDRHQAHSGGQDCQEKYEHSRNSLAGVLGVESTFRKRVTVELHDRFVQRLPFTMQ